MLRVFVDSTDHYANGDNQPPNPILFIGLGSQTAKRWVPAESALTCTNQNQGLKVQSIPLSDEARAEEPKREYQLPTRSGESSRGSVFRTVEILFYAVDLSLCIYINPYLIKYL